MAERMDSDTVQSILGVSHETRLKFETHVALLKKWQPAINLVGKATLDDVWRRHVLDSAQLARLVPEGSENLIDMGSGAGFPGLVLASMSVVSHVTLIESDSRKCMFLREAARALGVDVKIVSKRLEASPPVGKADVVTARALAPLPTLIEYAIPFFTPKTVGIFLKGKGFKKELTDSRKKWIMPIRTLPSLSDPAAVIIVTEGLPHDGRT